MDLSRMKSLRQVAEEMGLSDARVSQLCREANVKGVVVGTARLLSPKEVSAVKGVTRRPYNKTN